MERRSFRTELRAEQAAGKTYLIGRAASYGVMSHDLGGWREIIERGAFDDALSDPHLDVIHNLNHDASKILGRTLSGTTTLTSDARGLNYRTLLPDVSYARDAAELCKRGDLCQSSFAFQVDPDDEDWTTDTDDPDNPGQRCALRTISRIAKLFDVATVASGAYPQTAAGISDRSLPTSMPAELRARILQRASDDDINIDDDLDECECDCRECQDGNCDDCSNGDCEDKNCRCEQSMRAAQNDDDDGGKDTKKVDGEELPQSAFLIHGDPADKTTWKLPVRFSTLAKSEKHVRLAIDLFSTLKDVSEDEKARAWKELEALAEKYGIDIDNEDAERARAVDFELAMED
ncbi:MAG: HK97 family phage prohead protease [Bryobacteraceae bacterium]|jgi:uncharacterized protein